MTYVLEKVSAGTDLVVTGPWSLEAEECIRSGTADGLVLNYARGYQGDDLTLLRGLPLRRLDILDRSIGDLSAVYALAETLVSFRVQSAPHAIIKVDRLPLLTEISARWSQVSATFRYAPGLERVYLHSYTEPDLVPLAAATGMVTLDMKERPRLASLDGLEEFPFLAELGIFLAKNLEDIRALQRAKSPILRRVQFPYCRRITDITPVSECLAVSFFELSEGGELPDVEPLQGLRGLECLYLYGSTRVLSGDLSPIAGLPRLNDFRMMNRKSYSPSVSSIQAEIESRTGSTS